MLADAVRSVVVLDADYSIQKALEIADKIGCEQCGECCRLVGKIRITDKEVLSIASYLGKKPHKLKIHDLLHTPCRFQDGNNCSIHPVRMLVCKLFPTKPHRINGRTRIAIFTDCPAGRKYVGTDKEWL